MTVLSKCGHELEIRDFVVSGRAFRSSGFAKKRIMAGANTSRIRGSSVHVQLLCGKRSRKSKADGRNIIRIYRRSKDGCSP